MSSNFIVRRAGGNQIIIITDESAAIEVIQRNGLRHSCLFDLTDANLAMVTRYRWYLHEGYCCSVDESGREIYLTWLLYGRPPEGFIWHHLNGRLDNRSASLRQITRGLNNYAKGVQQNRSTGIRGISMSKNNRYVVLIGPRGKRKSFKDKDDAIKARKMFERETEISILQAPKATNGACNS